jgi:hypothetical protein
LIIATRNPCKLLRPLESCTAADALAGEEVGTGAGTSWLLEIGVVVVLWGDEATPVASWAF